MPDNKPVGMKWESFADQRIREAQAEGQFENLPGFGQPIPGIDEPLDENWWIKNKLRNEGLTVIPPVLEARRDIERTRSEIVDIANELLVRRRLQELNDRIEKAIHSPIAGPPGGVMLLDVEQELIAWRAARDAKEIDVK